MHPAEAGRRRDLLAREAANALVVTRVPRLILNWTPQRPF